MKTYSELIRLPTFEERFKYLEIGGNVGEDTFGFNRYLNQTFYTSDEWRSVRREVIIRDSGCDLAMPDREILGKRSVVVHHINPITIEDVVYKNFDLLLNPDYLITVDKMTHKAIHYGDESFLELSKITVRTENDTCPWRL